MPFEYSTIVLDSPAQPEKRLPAGQLCKVTINRADAAAEQFLEGLSGALGEKGYAYAGIERANRGRSLELKVVPPADTVASNVFFNQDVKAHAATLAHAPSPMRTEIERERYAQLRAIPA
jgi:hypothetical protein